MEESEKRRERLRAMRIEASSQVNSSESDPSPNVLSNPLIETPASEETCAAPRFDYYTNPMAAFSGNKRPNNVSHTPNKRPSGSCNQNMPGGFRPGGHGDGNTMVLLPPPPPLPPSGPRYPPYQHLPTPNMATFQPGYRHYSLSPVRSPSTTMGPYPIHQGPGPPYNPPGPFNYPAADQCANPHNTSSPRQNHGWQSPAPTPYNPPEHRGDSYQRGRGYHQGGNFSRRLVDKSMVEDPWKHLEPVVWKRTNFWPNTSVSYQNTSSVSYQNTSFDYQRSSSDLKKPEVVEISNTSKESLADYLASAFNDAVQETGMGADDVEETGMGA